MATRSEENIRILMRSYYDIQNDRIRTNNRIAGIEHVRRTGATKGELVPKEEDRDEKAHEKMIEEMISFYHKLFPELKSSTVLKIKARLTKEDGPIKNIIVWDLVRRLIDDLDAENRALKIVSSEVRANPVYKGFLSKVKGCGVLISANILATLDIHKARHVSSFWRYCGLDTWTDPESGVTYGRAKASSHVKEMMRDMTYIDSEGKEQTTKSLGFNVILKSKLIGVLGDYFIKHKNDDDAVYGPIYDDYKARQMARIAAGEKITKMTAHRRAVRYMIKMFLKDLWVYWRKAEGYPDEPDYCEEYIHHRAHGENFIPNNDSRKRLELQGAV